MARWLLVLLLAVSVGIGVVGACPEGRCADAPEAATDARDADDEHGDDEHGDDDCAEGECGDACGDHGAPHGDAGCETCPPQCAGCRVSALAPPSTTLIDRARAAAIVPTEPTATPIPAPPPHGLFRPPRA